MTIAVLVGALLGMGLGAVGAVVLVLRRNSPSPVAEPIDTSELVGRLLDANRSLLEQERLRAGSELDGKKSLIDQQLQSMTHELGRVNELVRGIEKERRVAFGELSNELRRQHDGLNALTEHTQHLREALASSKARGQWGERMAEDCCGSPGCSKASTTASRRRSAAAGPTTRSCCRTGSSCTWT
jgi:hypothetical protein